MALTSTTLVSAVTDSQTSFSVTSATGFAVGYQVQLDNESVEKVVAISGTLITVSGRGSNGTAAVAHQALGIVTVGPPADFPNAAPGKGLPISPTDEGFTTYSVNGAIALPDKDTTVLLNKAGVAAMTLAAPSAAQEGVTLTIIAGTAQANTVTQTTPGFNGAGTSGDVATFGGAIGDNMVVRAAKGVWYTVSLRNVTVA